MLFKTSLCCVLFVCNCSAMLGPSRAAVPKVLTCLCTQTHVGHTGTVLTSRATVSMVLSCLCTQTRVRHTRTLWNSCSAHTASCNLSHTINRADAALQPLSSVKSLSPMHGEASMCVHVAGHSAHICAGGETVGLHECTPKCTWAGRPGHPCNYGWGGCVPACVCTCVWHKQETGLWPLLLPYGREALQNMPDRWRQPLTTDLPHLPRTRPSPAASSLEGARQAGPQRSSFPHSTMTYTMCWTASVLQEGQAQTSIPCSRRGLPSLLPSLFPQLLLSISQDWQHTLRGQWGWAMALRSPSTAILQGAVCSVTNALITWKNQMCPFVKPQKKTGQERTMLH